MGSRLVRGGGGQKGRENNVSITNGMTAVEYATPHYFVNIIKYATAASDAERQLANQSGQGHRGDLIISGATFMETQSRAS